MPISNAVFFKFNKHCHQHLLENHPHFTKKREKESLSNKIKFCTVLKNDLLTYILTYVLVYPLFMGTPYICQNTNNLLRNCINTMKNCE